MKWILKKKKKQIWSAIISQNNVTNIPLYKIGLTTNRFIYVFRLKVKRKWIINIKIYWQEQLLFEQQCSGLLVICDFLVTEQDHCKSCSIHTHFSFYYPELCSRIFLLHCRKKIFKFKHLTIFIIDSFY